VAFWIKFLLFLVFFSGNVTNASPLKVMPMGASITEGGYNIDKVWHLGPGYRKDLKQVLKNFGVEIDFVGSRSHQEFEDSEHEGYSGYRIDQVAALAPSVILQFQPDVVLLMVGTNDVVQNYALGTAADRLVALVKSIRDLSSQTHVIVGSIITTSSPLYNARLYLYNFESEKKILSYFQKDTHVHWVDTYRLSKITSSKKDLTDGVHPTPSGYKKLAEVWAHEILSLKLSR